jgi:inosine-uridine nucleoside N-ribohydrolase
MIKEKFIIDTDPGVDDSLAIIKAFLSKMDILGITTVYGNSTIQNVTTNAQVILDLLEIENIKVYQGAAKSLLDDTKLAVSHGENGFGGFTKTLTKNYLSQKNAIQFMIECLESEPEKTVSIIVLGPSTNIALLGILRPDLIRKINRIVVLGGVVGEAGNISDYAEFNVYNDPLALYHILNYVDVEKVLIPINICRGVMFGLNDFDEIPEKFENNIKRITKNYINYYATDSRYGGFSGGVMYDLLAVDYVLHPEFFETKDAFVSVDFSGGERRGETVLVENDSVNCKLVVSADSEKIKKNFIAAFK